MEASLQVKQIYTLGFFILIALPPLGFGLRGGENRGTIRKIARGTKRLLSEEWEFLGYMDTV